MGKGLSVIAIVLAGLLHAACVSAHGEGDAPRVSVALEGDVVLVAIHNSGRNAIQIVDAGYGLSDRPPGSVRARIVDAQGVVPARAADESGWWNVRALESTLDAPRSLSIRAGDELVLRVPLRHLVLGYVAARPIVDGCRIQVQALIVMRRSRREPLEVVTPQHNFDCSGIQVHSPG